MYLILSYVSPTPSYTLNPYTGIYKYGWLIRRQCLSIWKYLFALCQCILNDTNLNNSLKTHHFKKTKIVFNIVTTEIRTSSPRICRVSTEFRRHGIPRNFLTSEVISAQFRRNSAKFRGIPRNFAGIEPEITSVFRGMPKCHFRGHPTHMSARDSKYCICSIHKYLLILFLHVGQMLFADNNYLMLKRITV